MLSSEEHGQQRRSLYELCDQSCVIPEHRHGPRWKLARNAHSWLPPRPTESETQGRGGERGQQSVLTSPPGDSGTH